YFPASLRNTSYGLVLIASPTLSLFHDDPYMKVMHAYDTIMPPQVPIPPLIIMPPSPLLSLIFNPQKFFVPEELLPPKEQVRAVGLIRWFERTESVFSRSNCTEDCKVKFATVKKMEDEFNNLVVKGNDLKTYARRFQELAVLCPNKMPNTEKLMEVFIRGLPRSIEGNVTASKPQTLEEATNITQRIMDQVTNHNFVQGTNDYKQKFDDRRNTNNYPNDRDNEKPTIATTTPIKITVTTTIITVTMTTTNRIIEGKKPSELMLSTQLKTVGMLETFPYIKDVDYIT
nr:reverse transcriptase domain-containing protein [Tanacetum cinerariifolium]